MRAACSNYLQLHSSLQRFSEVHLQLSPQLQSLEHSQLTQFPSGQFELAPLPQPTKNKQAIPSNK